MNLMSILQENARKYADVPAIIDKYRSIRFADLDRESAITAAWLKAHGLQAGDAVLVVQPVSIELYIVLLALFRLQLIAVFVDPQSGLGHIERCIRLHPPKAFIGSFKAQRLRLLSSAVRQIPKPFITGGYWPCTKHYTQRTRYAPLWEVQACADDTPALLTFTTGSTGQPKAAVRSHGFLMEQHRVLARSLRLKAGETDLISLPVFVLANLASGVASLIPDTDLRFPARINAQRVMAQVQKYRPCRCVASPAFFQCLAQYGESHAISMDSFTQVYTGGAPVFPRLLQRLQKAFPNADVVTVYGSTEAEPMAHVSIRRIARADWQRMANGGGLLVGTPEPAIELRIIRDQSGQPLGRFSTTQFQAAPLPVEQIGEIVVSGKHVLPGYWQGRGDEQNKFDVDSQRWHRTGDAGYLDHHGRLWLVGRCQAKVSDDKGMIYPFTVEAAAMQFPEIQFAAFISRNQQRILCVEAHERAVIDKPRMLAHLHWAQLHAIVVVKSIPKDPRHNAKVDYKRLEKLAMTN